MSLYLGQKSPRKPLCLCLPSVFLYAILTCPKNFPFRFLPSSPISSHILNNQSQNPFIRPERGKRERGGNCRCQCRFRQVKFSGWSRAIFFRRLKVWFRIQLAMDLEHGNGGSKNSRTNAKFNANETDPITPAGKMSGSRASSFSSSSSSSSDLFQVDIILGTPPRLKDEEDVQRELNAQNDTVFSGPASPSQLSDLRPETSFHCISLTQSPPAQLMERSGDDEPYRIPSSVFANSHSTTPLEWSAASNDSLFSIHVGNNSLSREHIFMLDGDPTKSGEITKSGEFIVFSSSPPSHSEENVGRKSVDNGKDFEMNVVANVPMLLTSADQNDEKIARPEVPSKSMSMRRSDASSASTQSFAFPVKKKCAWTSCFCTWPRCYCSNCSWAFCYFCNCSMHCCFSSPILTEEQSNISMKDQPEKPLSPKQPQPTATEATPSIAVTSNWLSCACCPYRCC